MSQGIEMIGKPLGPQQAWHVLDLKPSQICVGRRSLTTRHQFSVIVMGHVWLQKTVPYSSFPIFVGSLFPLFVATKSSHSNQSSLYCKIVSPSADGQIFQIFRGRLNHHHCFMLHGCQLHPPLLGFHLPWSAMADPWSFSTQVLESMLLNCHLTSYSKVFSFFFWRRFTMASGITAPASSCRTMADRSNDANEHILYAYYEIMMFILNYYQLRS